MNCFPGSPSPPPTVVKRISRAIFGRYGDMIYSVVKLLTFVTVVGVMLALTAYYFDIQLDLKNWAMTSNISESIYQFGNAKSQHVTHVESAENHVLEYNC